MAVLHRERVGLRNHEGMMVCTLDRAASGASTVPAPLIISASSWPPGAHKHTHTNTRIL